MSDKENQPGGFPVWLGDAQGFVPDASTWKEIEQCTTVTVATEDDDYARVKEVSVKDLMPRDAQLGMEDCAALNFLNLPNLLANVEHRYNRAATMGADENIYTSVGWLLLAVNPYRPCPALYNKETLQEYVGRPYSAVPPHPFAVSECAYSTLLKSWQSQSVVISGESGAGKTECSKHVLRYLAFLSDERYDGKLQGIENRILQSNPVLEAFGNAKTIRNNNSSRFGKLMKLHFSREGKIRGASIRTYLLAKSRVCHVPAQERNYHVFYWMCRSLRDSEREALCVRPWHEYRFLAADEKDNNSAAWPTAAFHGLRQSMSAIGISCEKQLEIFRVLSLVLSLGNVKFVTAKDGRGRFERGPSGQLQGEAMVACHLLGLEDTMQQAAFEECLTGRKIVDTVKLHNAEESTQAIEAVARALYERVFNYIVRAINVNLRDWHRLRGGLQKTSDAESSRRYIGILDIFGFEDLRPCSPNNFEQLCINYTNERLHRFFVEMLISADLQLYRSEGLEPPAMTDEPLNAALCSAIHGTKASPGIFQFLDEASMVPSRQPPDQVFCRRVNTSLPPSVIRRTLDRRRDETQQFTVNHFVGPVVYTAAGFTFRNTDFLTPDLKEFLAKVPNEFIVKELFPSPHNRTSRPLLPRSASQPTDFPMSDSSDDDDDDEPVVMVAPEHEDLTRAASGVAPGTGGGAVVRQQSVPSVGRGSHSLVKGGRQWRATAAARAKTVVGLFAVQVETLMRTLGKTHAFFIRCIKPNDTQAPRVFDRNRVRQQLQSGGILGSLELMGKGFPCRIGLPVLWEKFQALLPPAMKDSVGPKDFADTVMVFLKASPCDYRIGYSKAFFRFGLLQQLEKIASLVDEDEKKRFVAEMYILWRKKKLKRTLQAVRCATILQRCCVRARGRTQALAVHLFFQDVWLPSRRTAAAVRIQRWWRQQLDLRHVFRAELLQELVLRLQAIWRGKRVRNRLAMGRFLAATARAQYEALAGGCEWQAMRLAAMHLQAHARGALIRHAYMSCIESERQSRQAAEQAAKALEERSYRAALAQQAALQLNVSEPRPATRAVPQRPSEEIAQPSSLPSSPTREKRRRSSRGGGGRSDQQESKKSRSSTDPGELGSYPPTAVAAGSPTKGSSRRHYILHTPRFEFSSDPHQGDEDLYGESAESSRLHVQGASGAARPIDRYSVRYAVGPTEVNNSDTAMVRGTPSAITSPLAPYARTEARLARQLPGHAADEPDRYSVGPGALHVVCPPAVAPASAAPPSAMAAELFMTARGTPGHVEQLLAESTSPSDVPPAAPSICASPDIPPIMEEKECRATGQSLQPWPPLPPAAGGRRNTIGPASRIIASRQSRLSGHSVGNGGGSAPLTPVDDSVQKAIIRSEVVKVLKKMGFLKGLERHSVATASSSFLQHSSISHHHHHHAGFPLDVPCRSRESLQQMQDGVDETPRHAVAAAVPVKSENYEKNILPQVSPQHEVQSASSSTSSHSSVSPSPSPLLAGEADKSHQNPSNSAASSSSRAWHRAPVALDNRHRDSVLDVPVPLPAPRPSMRRVSIRNRQMAYTLDDNEEDDADNGSSSNAADDSDTDDGYSLLDRYGSAVSRTTRHHPQQQQQAQQQRRAPGVGETSPLIGRPRERKRRLSRIPRPARESNLLVPLSAASQQRRQAVTQQPTQQQPSHASQYHPPAILGGVGGASLHNAAGAAAPGHALKLEYGIAREPHGRSWLEGGSASGSRLRRPSLMRQRLRGSPSATSSALGRRRRGGSPPPGGRNNRGGATAMPPAGGYSASRLF